MDLREELLKIEPDGLVKAYEKFAERFDINFAGNIQLLEEHYPAFFQFLGHLGVEAEIESGSDEEASLVSAAVLKTLLALREYADDIASDSSAEA